MRKRLPDLKTKADAEEMIEYHIRQNGSHTHNLIGMVLRQTAEVLGYEVANELVDEFSLDLRYGMNKEPYKDRKDD